MNFGEENNKKEQREREARIKRVTEELRLKNAAIIEKRRADSFDKNKNSNYNKGSGSKGRMPPSQAERAENFESVFSTLKFTMIAGIFSLAFPAFGILFFGLFSFLRIYDNPNVLSVDAVKREFGEFFLTFVNIMGLGVFLILFFIYGFGVLDNLINEHSKNNRNSPSSQEEECQSGFGTTRSRAEGAFVNTVCGGIY